jgi:hypothetical protein
LGAEQLAQRRVKILEAMTAILPLKFNVRFFLI